MGGPGSHRIRSGLLARQALPVLAVVLGMLALEVGYDAEAGAALLFLGYEIGFRVLPGWLVYRVLASRPGGMIRQVALGWAVGATLEIVAFILTAALDARDAFTVYPLLVGIPAASIFIRRRRSARAVEPDPGPGRGQPWSAQFAWAVAGVCLLAMGLLAIVYFPTAPLPGSGSISYFRDYPWHLGLAAEAKHQWPILDPDVAGEPFPYHYFVHIHMAAASQVTGLDLPLIFFRLFNLPLILMSVLLYVTAGRSLARSGWVGLAAAALALLIGDLQLQTSQDLVPHAPFLGVFVAFLATSPSFLFGLPLFLALLVVVGERVAIDERGSFGDWAVVALLAIGATNAKVAILPLILGALAAFGAWRLLGDRRISGPALTAAALVGAALGVTYLSQYAGHSSGLQLGAFETFDQMPVVNSVKSYLGGVVSFPLESTVLGIGGVVLGTVGLLGAELAGVAWIAALRRRARVRREQVWVLAVTTAGVLAMFLLIAPGTGNQLYFLFYGVAAGWLVAADGFRLAWKERPAIGRSHRRALVIGGAWLALLIVVMRAPLDLDLFVGPDVLAQTHIFWYAGLAASLVLLIPAAYVFLAPARWWAGALISAALLIVGAIGTFSNYIIPALASTTTPQQWTASETLAPGKFAALSWIRDNTPTDSVVAVNNSDPYNFTYAGFAERAVFLQGWAYTREAFDQGYTEALARSFENLFTDRFALNEKAFAGDRGALAALAGDYGVRYLVVDSAGGMSANIDRIRRLATPVFQRPGIQVLQLREALVP